jgi:hypothetical protein
MTDLKIIFTLIFLLGLLLIMKVNMMPVESAAHEQFTSTGTLIQLATSHVPTPDEGFKLLSEQPDECRNGLYRCVYKTIPFGF